MAYGQVTWHAARALSGLWQTTMECADTCPHARQTQTHPSALLVAMTIAPDPGCLSAELDAGSPQWCKSQDGSMQAAGLTRSQLGGHTLEAAGCSRLPGGWPRRCWHSPGPCWPERPRVSPDRLAAARTASHCSARPALTVSTQGPCRVDHNKCTACPLCRPCWWGLSRRVAVHSSPKRPSYIEHASASKVGAHAKVCR